MPIKFKTVLPILSALLIAFIACKSAKNSQATKPQTETVNRCNQVIKYYSDKVKMLKDGSIINMNTEITISPSSKVISIEGTPPDQEKVKFDTEIETYDCSFNSDLTNGEAVYRGYITRSNGNKDKVFIKIEYKDGGLISSSADPDKPGDFIMFINKWEVVNQ